MEIDETTRERLGMFKIFEGLSHQEVDAVIACGKITQFQGGVRIIEESSQSFDLYLVLSGSVSIEMMVQNHLGQVERNMQIAVFRPGDIFGDMAFLSGTRRSASVSALEHFSAVVFDHDKLHELFENNTRIGYVVVKNIAKIMSNRLMELNFMMRDY